ncbi:hypothetical protein K445DRAFT_322034 [Daldinia sp. EC12]|uniref:MARVEL domain-containing protein n=1 Tax=Daldinia eschscholtzii TaxID=292717 RepID=A0AAX6MHA4_9PEZI|nr:hypothetical protein F4774DRAFT_114688 [Daldinia eschscholtzii]OTB11450.1 hypothetical protein K445DRAFT_322034 [Daldinia sp. EC12]
MALFEKLDVNPDKVPNTKLGLHIFQGVLAIVIFILEIVLFRADDSKINGNNGWPFGLCFLSIPAWIYLALAPRFERTRKAAQPHVMVVMDTVFTIFWLSAFASQAAYNTANSCGQGCSVSKAIVGIAFFETLAWAATTAVSVYTLRYYQRTDSLPGYENIGASQNIDPDKAAFSMAPHDEEAYAPVQMDDHHDDDRHDGPYDPDSFGGRFDNDTAYRPHSTSPAPLENPFDTYRTHSTSPAQSDPYGDPYGSQTSRPHIYAPPAAEEYDDDRPVQFPSANYDRTLH